MRRYLITTGTLFIIIGSVIILVPNNAQIIDIMRAPLVESTIVSFVYCIGFILSGFSAFIASYALRPKLQIYALSFMLGVGVAWLVTLLYSAFVYGSDIIKPIIWAYILLSIIRSLPFASIGVEEDKAITDALDSIRRTLESNEKRARDYHTKHESQPP